jgi:hypothetical protein
MKKLIILIAFLITSNCYAGDWGTCTSIGICGFNPSLPVFGPGPLTNLGDEGATSNAMAHIAWALAIPLLGEKIGGKKGKWIAGLTWIGLTLIQESFFHAPQNPGAAYPSEVRTDLITRIVPTIIVLSF